MTLLNHERSRKVIRPITLACLVLSGLLLQPMAAPAQPGGKLVNIDNVRIGFITGPSEPGDPGDLKNHKLSFRCVRQDGIHRSPMEPGPVRPFVRDETGTRS